METSGDPFSFDITLDVVLTVVWLFLWGGESSGDRFSFPMMLGKMVLVRLVNDVLFKSSADLGCRIKPATGWW
jgi:hypothetical protein